MLDATIETLHYAQRDDRVLALIAVKAGFGLAAGVLALIPVFGADRSSMQATSGSGS